MVIISPELPADSRCHFRIPYIYVQSAIKISKCPRISGNGTFVRGRGGRGHERSAGALIRICNNYFNLLIEKVVTITYVDVGPRGEKRRFLKSKNNNQNSETF